MSSDLYVKNASEICIPDAEGPGVTRYPNYELLIRNGKVIWLGNQGSAPADSLDCPIYDAKGGAVLPGLVDFHTHLIYAGDRVADFALRSQGVSYAQIAASGGGILTTVEATRKADVTSLATNLRERLQARKKYGISTTEVKSGYGLSLEHELQMLEAAAMIRSEGWDLELTLLAAHTVPKDTPKNEYLRQINEELIPLIAQKNLARFVDVFVEKGAYSIEDARSVYRAGQSYGLIPRVHADQITAGGGAELAAEVQAASADHLENISDDGIQRMREAKVVAGLLPGAAVFLGDHITGLGRRFIEAGVEVAVATDANPGSSPLYNLPLAATFATTLMGLTADQALRSVTLGAAHALRRSDVGSLSPGMCGRFIVLDNPDSRALVYAFGEPIVRELVCTDLEV